MSDRRTEILDAALRVLAEHGMRGLTHRAVDAAAGIAPGSTSYYFRSRSALVTGCVDRLLALDRAVEVPEVAAASPADLVDVLVAVTVGMATTGRHRTLARYELSLASVREPQLREALVEGGDVIRRLGARTLAAAGAVDPAAAAAELAALMDGLAFTALVRGPDDVAALAAWVRPPIERAVGGRARTGRERGSEPRNPR
jgi:DNA-binding transcriptional regulator YbjK